MSISKQDIIKYGAKAVLTDLVAGSSGNISARDGNIIWIKPIGMAMDEISTDDLCGIDLRSGEQVAGENAPSSELHMHLEIYRARTDVNAVLHTHPPWLSGVISAGEEIKPVMVHYVVDLGRIQTIPALLPGTRAFAETIGNEIKEADTLFIVNNGVIATGATVRQAYQRSSVAENAAKAFIAATIAGRPRHFLKTEQAEEIRSLRSIQQRTKAIESNS